MYTAKITGHLLRCGVRIMGRKYLNRCTPPFRVSQWSGVVENLLWCHCIPTHWLTNLQNKKLSSEVRVLSLRVTRFKCYYCFVSILARDNTGFPSIKPKTFLWNLINLMLYEKLSSEVRVLSLRVTRFKCYYCFVSILARDNTGFPSIKPKTFLWNLINLMLYSRRIQGISKGSYWIR